MSTVACEEGYDCIPVPASCKGPGCVFTLQISCSM